MTENNDRIWLVYNPIKPDKLPPFDNQLLNNNIYRNMGIIHTITEFKKYIITTYEYYSQTQNITFPDHIDIYNLSNNDTLHIATLYGAYGPYNITEITTKGKDLVERGNAVRSIMPENYGSPQQHYEHYD